MNQRQVLVEKDVSVPRILRDAPQPVAISLSIILVNYKTTEFTLKCLQSIYDHPPQCSFEVIVMDNASYDDIEVRVCERFPRVRFLETGENMGFARANNLGIHNSHGRYVVLLNNDTMVIEPIFDEMMAFMENNSGVGILGPRHIDTEGRFQPSSGKFPTFMSEAIRKIIHYRLSVDDYRVRDYLDVKSGNGNHVDWVSGSCLMVRRRTLEDIGLLDERFFMYFEDIDFCRRAQDSGWEVRFISNRSLMHHGGASARKNLMSVLIQNRKSQLYFSGKYYGLLGEWVIRILLLVKYGFNLIRWVAIFGIQKLFGHRGRHAYTMALLSKKVILISLRRVPSRALVPALLTAQFAKSR
jgi:GT2 family glycosyltransferase